jgi:spermidine synthase
MKPTIDIASATLATGEVLALSAHDSDYMLRINGEMLMSTRAYTSEEALAQIGCGHLTTHPKPNVFIGGLGLGFTLRSVLPIVNQRATVVVAELVPQVVEWNRTYLKEINRNALDDPRVQIHVGDAFAKVTAGPMLYDAILMDIDNGPAALCTPGNELTYERDGVLALRDSLKPLGVIAFWSSRPEPKFASLLKRWGFQVETFDAKPYPGSKRAQHGIILASPEGAEGMTGGAPRKKKWRG